METPSPSPSSSQVTLRLQINWRIVALVLTGVIGVMLLLWQPWKPAAPTKTITVRGEATLEREPDRFRFTPVYQGDDIAKVTTKGNEVVAKLKTLGVSDGDIQTNVYDASSKAVSPSMPQDSMVRTSATYSITVTVKDKALAQKVADYLATTGATGMITPQADFSKDTRTALDLEARRKASDDAKAKASTMAKQLGVRLGKVTKVTEESGYGFGTSRAEDANKLSVTPTLQPGRQELTFSFSVTFEIR